MTLDIPNAISAIKNTTLIKGGMPANYGSRLSSVVDISMKDGNNKQYHAAGGIGLISSRLTLEGPLINEKSSFMLSGRRTYVDVLMNPFLKGSDYEGNSYFFYDLNAFHILRNGKINLNIIVINNNGGQIFSRLPYSNDNIKEFNKYWITPLETSIVEACNLFKLNYLKSTIKEIGSNLKKTITKKPADVYLTGI